MYLLRYIEFLKFKDVFVFYVEIVLWNENKRYIFWKEGVSVIDI